MKKAKVDYSAQEICSAFKLPVSSYYYQAVGLSSKDKRMIVSIKAISESVSNTYGKRRMKLDLEAEGYTIGRYKTKKLMNHAGIKVVIPRKRHYYENNKEESKLAPNILNRRFNPEKANTYWVGDITYIRTYQGWVYLACVMDLYSKEIIGYAVEAKPSAQLAKQALVEAIKLKQPTTKQLLFHSDQGCQYSAKKYRKYLSLCEIKQSMSRRGNCWDNSVMERFFRSLKTERLNKLSFKTKQEAVNEVRSYINFYNYQRRHSAIGYLTPHQKSCRAKHVA